MERNTRKRSECGRHMHRTAFGAVQVSVTISEVDLHFSPLSTSCVKQIPRLLLRLRLIAMTKRKLNTKWERRDSNHGLREAICRVRTALVRTIIVFEIGVN